MFILFNLFKGVFEVGVKIHFKMRTGLAPREFGHMLSFEPGGSLQSFIVEFEEKEQEKAQEKTQGKQNIESANTKRPLVKERKQRSFVKSERKTSEAGSFSNKSTRHNSKLSRPLLKDLNKSIDSKPERAPRKDTAYDSFRQRQDRGEKKLLRVEKSASSKDSAAKI